jgi:hypothetical protein
MNYISLNHKIKIFRFTVQTHEIPLASPPPPGYGEQKAAVIGVESTNAAGKGDVLAIMDDIAKLDKAGTALLRDKKEMLAAIGVSTEINGASQIAMVNSMIRGTMLIKNITN